MAHELVIVSCNDGIWKNGAVPVRTNVQSPAQLKARPVALADGKEGRVTVQLAYADRVFGVNAPFKGDVVAISINQDAIRKDPSNSKLDICSDYKVLAVGTEAVARFMATPAEPANAVPTATVDEVPFA